jgi:DegV family protein with EDD domain
MANCQLIIDSCCDLPPEIVCRPDIYMLHFPYMMDGGAFEDDLFQTRPAADFYGAMREGSAPTTSQLQGSRLIEVFTQVAEAERPAVYLSFSSGLSGSYDAAMMAREQILVDFPNFELHIVDTHLASVAEGLLVLEAVNQWERGLDAAALAAWAEEARALVDCQFMVEDLDTLRRGGRIPASVAVAGAALDVKPMLTIDVEGKLKLTGVARGRKKGIKQLVEYYKKNVCNSGFSNYCVLGHADCVKDLHKLKDELLKIDQSIIFVESNVGPVIGSHVGPGMLACVFWNANKAQNMSVAEKIAKRVAGGI